VDNFLRLKNRHTGEILRMRRVHDPEGQIALTLDGSLPPRASGPPLHVHFHEHEEGIVRAGKPVGRKRGSVCIRKRAPPRRSSPLPN
jgi:hypothetical protein